MKKRLFGLCFSVLAGASQVSAEELAPTDIIKNMVGCFKVTFNYVEDGDHDAIYEPVYERAELISEQPLVLQRHLIVDGVEQRHWSEEWTATNVANREWHQKVIGPFDDFRYECDGVWTLNQWSCLAPKAQKPRRDRERPYAYLDRLNTLQVNPKRWIHAQTNKKYLEDGSLYSVELGWNVYEKVDDAECVIP